VQETVSFVFGRQAPGGLTSWFPQSDLPAAPRLLMALDLFVSNTLVPALRLFSMFVVTPFAEY